MGVGWEGAGEPVRPGLGGAVACSAARLDIETRGDERVAATQKPLAALRRDVIGLDALTRPRLVSRDPGPNKPTKTLRYPCQRLFPSSPGHLSTVPFPVPVALLHDPLRFSISRSISPFGLLAVTDAATVSALLLALAVVLVLCLVARAGSTRNPHLTSSPFLNRCRCIFYLSV